MKKEGTGDPRAPDITFSANVKMRELYFEDVPDPEVGFRGNTRRNSVWESKRRNLPDEVEEGVVYRDAGVRVRIATEVAEDDPDSLKRPDKERENAHQERRRQNTGQQETQTKKEKK
jgi:hypothetical protein